MQCSAWPGPGAAGPARVRAQNDWRRAEAAATIWRAWRRLQRRRERAASLHTGMALLRMTARWLAAARRRAAAAATARVLSFLRPLAGAARGAAAIRALHAKAGAWHASPRLRHVRSRLVHAVLAGRQLARQPCQERLTCMSACESSCDASPAGAGGGGAACVARRGRGAPRAGGPAGRAAERPGGRGLARAAGGRARRRARPGRAAAGVGRVCGARRGRRGRPPRARRRHALPARDAAGALHALSGVVPPKCCCVSEDMLLQPRCVFKQSVDAGRGERARHARPSHQGLIGQQVRVQTRVCALSTAARRRPLFVMSHLRALRQA